MPRQKPEDVAYQPSPLRADLDMRGLGIGARPVDLPELPISPRPMPEPPNAQGVFYGEQLRQLDNPPPRSTTDRILGILAEVGQGITPMQPQQFQQLRQQRQAQEYAEKADTRRFLADQVNTAAQTDRQRAQDQLTQAKASREEALYPLQLQEAELGVQAGQEKLRQSRQASTMSRTEAYPPGSLIIVTGPDGKEIGRETVPFKEAPQTERNIDPLSPEGIAARQRLDASTREPSFEWVVRGGQPTQIQKGTAKPGDRPYDASRQPAAEASPYAAERALRTVQSVDELLGKVSRMTTGLGSLTSVIPESPARNFRAELDTLKANIAFNELTAMREASKTGGALGQVSNVELGLLQSALGALDAGQSPANIKAQLEKIKASVQRWQKAVASAGANTAGADGAVQVTDPSGKVHTFPNQAAAEAFKKAAGIK